MHKKDAYAAYGHQPGQPEKREQKKLKNTYKREIYMYRSQKRDAITFIFATHGPSTKRQRLSSSWYGITIWPVAADRPMSLVARKKKETPSLSSRTCNHLQQFAPHEKQAAFQLLFFFVHSVLFAPAQVIIKQWAQVAVWVRRILAMNMPDMHMHGIWHCELEAHIS